MFWSTSYSPGPNTSLIALRLSVQDNPGPIPTFLFFARASWNNDTFLTFWQPAARTPAQGAVFLHFLSSPQPGRKLDSWNSFRGTNQELLVRDDSLYRVVVLIRRFYSGRK